jgi:sarcosine dehydrogenase
VVRGKNRTVYTQALNNKGGIESDYTVTQIADNDFMIITGTAFGGHDGGWLRKKQRELGYSDVQIADITSELAVFGIWGPKARDILQSITSHDLGNESFPFMSSQELTISGSSLRATRVTYVGELGWELYVPVNSALKVWEALISAGKPFGADVCGYRAIESLRLEKGYLAWGVEINTETNPFEAGLGFAVSQKKENFIGRTSLLEKKEVSRKLVAIIFDDIRQVPIGNEPIRKDGQIIGRIKSGGQGYTINKAIAYAYLPVEFSAVGTLLEVEFFGTWHTGKISASPLFDPEGLRIKA